MSETLTSNIPQNTEEFLAVSDARAQLDQYKSDINGDLHDQKGHFVGADTVELLQTAAQRPTYAEVLSDPLLMRERNQSKSAQEKAAEPVEVQATREPKVKEQRILSSRDYASIVESFKVIEAGGTPDKLVLQRDFNDSAKTHDAKQKEHLEAFMKDAALRLEKHGRQRQIDQHNKQLGKDRAESEARSEAAKVAASERADRIEREIYKAKLNGGGEFAMKGKMDQVTADAAAKVDAQLLDEARARGEVVDPMYGPNLPTVTEQRRAKAEADQAEYIALLKGQHAKAPNGNLDTDPATTAAAGLTAANMNAILNRPDTDSDDDFDRLPQGSDQVVTATDDLEPTIEPVTETTPQGFKARMARKFRNAKVELGIFMSGNAIDYVKSKENDVSLVVFLVQLQLLVLQ